MKFCYALADSFIWGSVERHGNGFANTKMVLIFGSEDEREKYLENTRFTGARKLSKREAIQYEQFAFWFGEETHIPEFIKRKEFLRHQWQIVQRPGEKRDFIQAVSICRVQSCTCKDYMFYFHKGGTK